jgi:DNA-binding XRE family transcriptional regulator
MDRPNRLTFRASMLRLRDRIGVTQSSMAQLIGIGRTELQNYEYGKRLPNPATQKRINELMEKHPA